MTTAEIWTAHTVYIISLDLDFIHIWSESLLSEDQLYDDLHVSIMEWVHSGSPKNLLYLVIKWLIGWLIFKIVLLY